MPRKKTKRNYIYAVGKRRRSTARIRLFKGQKENMVNEKLIGEYFPGKIMASKWQEPFLLTETNEKYYVTVKVAGGGKVGQLEATTHGIAKALLSSNDKFKKALKTAGLLTRDARIRERRKVGTGGRARRKKQSPKR